MEFVAYLNQDDDGDLPDYFSDDYLDSLTAEDEASRDDSTEFDARSLINFDAHAASVATFIVSAALSLLCQRRHQSRFSRFLHRQRYHRHRRLRGLHPR